MDNKSIFVKTGKGEDESRSRVPHLSGDIRRALLMVDGQSTFEELSKRAAPSMRAMLGSMFAELERSGFIQNKANLGKVQSKPAPGSAVKSGVAPRMAIPAGMVIPPKKPSNANLEELDFTAAFRVPSPEVLAAEAAKADAERLKKEVEAKAREEAEAKARKEVEAAKLKAQQEADAARVKAEQEADKARKGAEDARLKAEQEAVRARKEAEAAKLKAQQEAEAVRLKAEQEAAKAREEAVLAKKRAEAEARAREQAEQQARERAEAARVKAEQEAARVRAELAAAQAKAEADARAHAEAEAKARMEIEAAKLKAQQEAEAARLKAEQEAVKAREEAELAKRRAEEIQAKLEAEAKAREEAEHRAREQAEAARLKAEQEAAQAREETERIKREAAEAKARAEAAEQQAQAEAAKAREEAELAKRRAEEEARAKVEAEAKAREEAEHRAREQAEAARLKAEQEAAAAQAKIEAETKAREESEAEAARIKVEQEAAKAREEAEQLAIPPSRKTEGTPAKRASSVSATVLFFDVVGYTKQSVNKQIKIKKQFNHLVSECLATLDEGERIILDTGDGAAIGFLQHPEDALQVARQFREAVTAHRHKDYPDLNVRTGIHLGPINVVKDMNGQSNMVGDGINDAQRVMSFAGVDQIFISRPYYDFISRLSDEYADLFQYRGMKQDKHGREHAVYELVDVPEVQAPAPISEAVKPAIQLEPFVFAATEVGAVQEPVAESEESAPTESTLLGDMMAGQAADTTLLEGKFGQGAVPAKVEQVEPEKQGGKPVAEARMPTEEEVAAIAAAQAKVWSEAEQRAAKANEERAAQAAQSKSEAKKAEEPKVKARRKPIPWGGVGAGLFVLLVMALFVVPFVLPMQERAANLEQMLSAQFKQPVHIGKMSGRLLPTPRIELAEVSIGEAKQIQVKTARVDFAFSALFSSTKAINTLGLEGVQVDGAMLQQLPLWLQQVAGDTQYPVRQVELDQVTLETDALKLAGIGGRLSFDGAGKFEQAKLHANDNKYELEVNAAPESKLKVAIMVRNSAPPLLPGWVFEDMRANGELSRDELVITDLDGSALDGRVLGDARLSWGSGWYAKGNLIAKAITLQKISATLSGDMDGSARFQMRADSLAKLVGSSVLEGSFSATKGTINGFDLVETARLRSRESQAGGRTHFDELSGELTVDNGRYRFRQLKMKAGVLSASGSFEMENQQLSGRVTADLSMRSGMGSVGLQIDGTADNPVLHAR